MSVRKGYLYALLLAIGLLLWTNVAGAFNEQPAAETASTVSLDASRTPWTSEEALYECAMKAQELGLVLTSMHTAEDVDQGSLVLSGTRDALTQFIGWLETEGRYRAILSFQMTTEDENQSQLSLSVQM